MDNKEKDIVENSENNNDSEERKQAGFISMILGLYPLLVLIIIFSRGSYDGMSLLVILLPIIFIMSNFFGIKGLGIKDKEYAILGLIITWVIPILLLMFLASRLTFGGS